MLLKLSVKNFAILSNIELDFNSGLTVISGESGAGKSMVIEAVNYLYGKRASVDDIRYDTDGSVIEGVFDFPESKKLKNLLEEFQIEEDELYIVRREIMQNKKSIIKINHRLITLNTLRTIMNEVLSIYAQSSQGDALDESMHINYLDKYIGISNDPASKHYRKHYKEYRLLSDKISDLEYKDRNRLQSLENYRIQFEELSSLELKDNEETLLEEELDYLSNYEKVHESLSMIHTVLSSEYNPQGMLYDLNNHLENLSAYDQSYKDFSPEVMNLYHLLNELSFKVSSDRTNVEYDESRLNDIQSRLNTINHLKRKYNRTFEGLIELQNELMESINELDNINESFDLLKQEKDTAFQNMEKYAKELHQIRINQKHFLENRIRKELQDLDMKNAEFEIQVKENGFKRSGYTEVKFFISTNKGEPLKEMNKVASGGEMARVMLSLKTIFTEFDSQSLLILDEIDTGVSGQVATKMALKMRLLSKARQVFVISHLPQAAAASDHHLYINKKTDNNRTVAVAHYLDKNEHRDEIARMLSSEDITEAAQNNADHLISSFQ